MARPNNIDELQRLLATSRLLSAERLDATRAIPAATPLDLARTLVNRGWLTRYQAERLLEGQGRGYAIGPYRILELLGIGGMAVLYLVEDPASGERLALKTISEKHRNDPGILARLRLEARAGELVRHPNVVAVRGLEMQEHIFGETPCLVMEFIEGISLDELLQISGLPAVGATCDFIRQAALGLAAAHDAGVIHRDIKPANLLVSASGVVKVLDFGLALLGSQSDADEFSLAMLFGHDCLGTADFISPEQIREGRAVGPAADVYSLGATFYSLLAGQTPFPLKTTREKLEAQRGQVPPPVNSLVPEIPGPVSALIARMLAKIPEERPRSMREVAGLLEPFARTGPVEFDFPRVLAFRAREARRRRPLPSGATPQPASGSGTSRDQSHWTTMSTRALSRTSSVSGESGTKSGSAPPVILDPDPGFGTAVTRAATTPPPGGQTVLLEALDGGPPISLRQDRVTVGRSPECDVLLVHAAVSGRHCVFRRHGDQWFVADLGSRNGTQLNQQMLLVADQEHPLQPGDTITIGKTLRYRFPGTPRQEPPAVAGTARKQHWLWIALGVVTALAILGWLGRGLRSG